MRLLFAVLARAAVLHDADDLTIVRVYRRILIEGGRIRFPSSIALPQRMTFRLRLGARGVAAIDLLLT